VSKANGSRFGAVQAYWAAESATVAASQVKLRKIELELKKLFALGYATDELLQDAAALEAIMVSAFRTEIGFRTEDSVYRGTGDGMPLGIMKSPSLITQAIEGTQTIANTNQFIAANVAKMLSRVPASLWGDLVFLMTPELLPYLVQAVIGTNGVVPVFLPPNGLADSPMGTILGRPAIFSDYCEAVGTPGDIMAAALSQYALADKASEQVAQSMHVRFLTDEMTYRVTYRVDGQPEWRTALTPYKGGNTRSPFIVLNTRS
jgi:HK97 family phage major capsid protein